MKYRLHIYNVAWKDKILFSVTIRELLKLERM